MHEEAVLTLKIRDDRIVRLLRLLLGEMAFNSIESITLLADAQHLLQMAECREFMNYCAHQKADTTLDLSGLAQLRVLLPGTLAVPSSDSDAGQATALR